MKKILLVLGFLVFVSGSCAEELKVGGLTLEYDKMLHFAAGYIISDLVFTIQKSNNAGAPFLVSTAAGVGKELLDSVFDWKDLGYTELGSGTKIFVNLSGSGAKEFHLGSLTFEYDKILQFAAGYVIAEMVFGIQKSDDIILPVLIPSGLAAVKELFDSSFDWKDFGCTALGAALRSALRVSFKF